PGVKVQLKDGTNLIDGPIYQSLSSNDSGPTITLQGLSCYYDNGNQIVNWQGDIPEEFSIEWSGNYPFAGLEEANSSTIPDLSPSITLPAEPGQYTVMLTLKDPGGRVVGSDSITINANRPTLTIRADTSAPVERPATVDGGQAGATIDLYGMAAGGRIDRFEWVQLGGPAEVTIANAESLITTAGLPQPGVYEFGLLAKIGEGGNDSQTVGFASVEAELRPGDPLLRIADRADANNHMDVIRIEGGSSEKRIVNLFAIVEGGQWDHVQWSVLSLPVGATCNIGEAYSNQTWVTFSMDGCYTIQAAVWDVEGTEPLVTRQVVVCVGDCDPDDITPGNPSGSGVQITVEPESTTYELGRTTPLPLRADLSSGILPEGATIRWHLAGYRNEPADVGHESDVTIEPIAAIHNYTTWSPSVGFSAAGIYVVAAEVFDDGEFLCSDVVEITVTYPNIMVRAWVEKQVESEWKPEGKFYVLDLSEPNPNIRLNGSVTFDDSEEHDIDVQWAVLIGSQSVSFSETNSRPTIPTFTQPGIYTVAMVAMSGGVAVGMDTVTVRAYSTATWTGSVVHAGSDKVAILGEKGEPAVLTIDDAMILPETPTGIVWSCEPSTGVSFDNSEIVNPTVAFSAEGQYVLTLTYGTTQDKANVTVYPQSEVLVVDAGSYDKVVLPKALLLNNATAVCASNMPLEYEWRVTAPVGADVVFFPSSNMLNPQVSFPNMTEDVAFYNLQLKITAGDHTETDSALIEVRKMGSDSTPPRIESFTASSATEPITLGLTAIDEESGIRKIELRLKSQNSETAIPFKTFLIPSPCP
ncbi:MAG: hypothetical protein GX455_07720, partial [Phycisphaerae bacterium]|nr:hypothetical protein [Phycisphaerae bacterium]